MAATLCSRFRRRAVYEACRELGANVIALGHTADDFCEAFLRNAMFTGRVAALPPVTWSRKKEFRLIRPLMLVTEDLTTAYARACSAPVVPCGCSQKTGTVRRSIREIFAELEKEHPHLKQTLLTAMSNLTPVAAAGSALPGAGAGHRGRSAGGSLPAGGERRVDRFGMIPSRELHVSVAVLT